MTVLSSTTSPRLHLNRHHRSRGFCTARWLSLLTAIVMASTGPLLPWLTAARSTSPATASTAPRRSTSPPLAATRSATHCPPLLTVRRPLMSLGKRPRPSPSPTRRSCRRPNPNSSLSTNPPPTPSPSSERAAEPACWSGSSWARLRPRAIPAPRSTGVMPPRWPAAPSTSMATTTTSPGRSR